MNMFLPKKTYFNEAKGTTTIVFEERPRIIFDEEGRMTSLEIVKPSFTAKASKEDLPNFDKKLGFLVAYFHFATNRPKGETNAKYESLFCQNTEDQKKFLLGVFCLHSGLSFDQALKFIDKVVK